ncbi:MAG: ATP-binding cassette domain-containing protein [Rhodanobacter sp.]|nr:MAG: ATP-binding cassette domain-containing protein [Rhodanobacter sp.]TAM06842.1 MAG: ATP-binding cassette domain-containing protein [Rhodanobacter sp.]TAM40672.1 MAG: ATP-binding cassette domain-containing protein [Rhodanobacter sp.]TAN27894.1 MAG: ATP-binding cassette domain-containing protein [Rhodanobacter sp.]
MSIDTTARELPAADAALLEIDRASVVQGAQLALDRLTLRVAGGQHTAILGPNGSGKSTLVKLITRQLYPLAQRDGGGVRIFGRERWNVEELRGLLGIVSPSIQRNYTSAPPLEVFDAVVSGFLATRGVTDRQQVSAAMSERAFDALAQIDASHLSGRMMETLSTGEVQRVLIARALVHRPRALLLDEPSAGLDMASRRQLLESLRQVARQGTTLLLVTHHVEEILPEIEQLVLLRDGRVLQQGSKADLLANNALCAAFGARVQVTRHGDYYAAVLA